MAVILQQVILQLSPLSAYTEIVGMELKDEQLDYMIDNNKTIMDEALPGLTPQQLAYINHPSRRVKK